jgi:hypothetical protein
MTRYGSARVLSRVNHHECHRTTVKMLADIAALKAQVRALRKLVRDLGGKVPA